MQAREKENPGNGETGARTVANGDGHANSVAHTAGNGQYGNGNDPNFAILNQLSPAKQAQAAAAGLAFVAQSQGTRHNDDTGNAERFVAQHGDNVRYVHTWGKWLVWNGVYWKEDEKGATQQLAKATARSIHIEAAAAVDDAASVALSKWARASGSASRRAAMLTLAQSEPPIAITHRELNLDPLLVACENGTIDLRTGQLRPSHRDDLITHSLPVAYDPAATCPTWQAFIQRMIPDPVMREFLQRAVGLTLSGLTVQKLFFLHGNGSNGKSTICEIILALMGDRGYGQKTRADMLMYRDRSGIPNDVASLVGKRAVVVSEVQQDQRLNEALVKDLTGGDTISARFLNQEFFTFRPEFKLWMYGNHKPKITGTDDGIWRRIILIPFTVQVPESQKDDQLPNKLKAELPGILQWALEGWRMYQAHGLKPPAAVNNATAAYRNESDVIGKFLDECTIQKAGAEVKGGPLYEAYQKWTVDNGLGKLSNLKFAEALEQRGFRRGDPTTRKRRTWLDLGLLAD